MELGLLDRPLSQYWRQKGWRTGPLPSERVDRRVNQSTGADEEVEDNGDFDQDHEDDGDHSSNADSDGNSDGDSSSDYGSLNGEDSDNLDSTFRYLAPRPLSFSNWTTDGPPESLKFPKLKHLYLCKPAEGEVGNSMYEVIYSSRVRGACVYEWFWLLHGARETLETLVLEHRTCAVAPEEFYVPSSFLIK